MEEIFAVLFCAMICLGLNQVMITFGYNKDFLLLYPGSLYCRCMGHWILILSLGSDSVSVLKESAQYFSESLRVTLNIVRREHQVSMNSQNRSLETGKFDG
jgi:hypothetical protein